MYSVLPMQWSRFDLGGFDGGDCSTTGGGFGATPRTLAHDGLRHLDTWTTMTQVGVSL